MENFIHAIVSLLVQQKVILVPEIVALLVPNIGNPQNDPISPHRSQPSPSR